MGCGNGCVDSLWSLWTFWDVLFLFLRHIESGELGAGLLKAVSAAQIQPPKTERAIYSRQEPASTFAMASWSRRWEGPLPPVPLGKSWRVTLCLLWLLVCSLARANAPWRNSVWPDDMTMWKSGSFGILPLGQKSGSSWLYTVNLTKRFDSIKEQSWCTSLTKFNQIWCSHVFF